MAENIRDRGAEQWGHCAVLARAKWLLDRVVIALNGLGVSAVVASRKDEFSTPPYRWLHSGLRLANSRQDREQLSRIQKAFYAIEGVDIHLPLPSLDTKDPTADFFRDWTAAALASPYLESPTRAYLTHLRARVIGEFDADRFIGETLAWLEVAMQRDDVATREGFEDYHEEREAWSDLLKSTRAKYSGEPLGLAALLQESICTRSRPPRAPMLTVHAAKGLEFSTCMSSDERGEDATRA